MRCTGAGHRALMTLSPETVHGVQRRPGGGGPSPGNPAGCDLVLVRASERVPVDGVVVEGDSAVDDSLDITGESIPKRNPWCPVFVGTTDGSVRRRSAGRLVGGGDPSRLSRSSWSKRRSRKSRRPASSSGSKRRYAWFRGSGQPPGGDAAPVALGMSWSETVAPGHDLPGGGLPVRPGGFDHAAVSGTSTGARHGILFKGGSHREIMGQLDVVAFDKTGTLNARPAGGDGRSGPGRRGRGPPAGAGDHRLAGKVVRDPLAAAGWRRREAERVPLLELEELQETPGRAWPRKGCWGPVPWGERRLCGAAAGPSCPGSRGRPRRSWSARGKPSWGRLCRPGLGRPGVPGHAAGAGPRVIRRLRRRACGNRPMLTGDTQEAARPSAPRPAAARRCTPPCSPRTGAQRIEPPPSHRRGWLWWGRG